MAILQSLISIVSRTMRRLNSVPHGIDTLINFAVRNGGDSGVRPAIEKSWT
jgi:hypothetical protein